MRHLAASDAATETQYDIYVKFYEWTNYDCVIQEIFLPDGSRLVEVFRTPNGRFCRNQRDHHSSHWDSTPTRPYVRRMFVYPGNVEGVDWTPRGFAQLPQNLDGTIKTSIGKGFNKKYQKKHETKGRITASDRTMGFWWTIEFNKGKVRVIVPALREYSP